MPSGFPHVRKLQSLDSAHDYYIFQGHLRLLKVCLKTTMFSNLSRQNNSNVSVSMIRLKIRILVGGCFGHFKLENEKMTKMPSGLPLCTVMQSLDQSNNPQGQFRPIKKKNILP